MIKEASLKLFLTSGVTITVKENEEIQVISLGEKPTLFQLGVYITKCIKSKEDLDFNVNIPYTYKDENGEEQTQIIKHYYHIPVDRISWHMLEEV